MTISSQILSKLERLILLLLTRFVQVKSRIHQNCDIIDPNFGANVYALAFLRICSYTDTKKVTASKERDQVKVCTWSAG